MNVPANLKYSKSHEWIDFSGDVAKIGITDFAQSSLNDIVFVNLPEVGDAVSAGESFGEVESVKAVSDVLSPVSGSVSAINEALLDAPEQINADPYGSWLIEVAQPTAQQELLDAAAYETFCAEEG